MMLGRNTFVARRSTRQERPLGPERILMPVDFAAVGANNENIDSQEGAFLCRTA